MSYCRQNPTLWPGQSLSSPIRRRFFDPPNGAIRWMHQYVCIRLNTSAYVCLVRMSDDGGGSSSKDGKMHEPLAGFCRPSIGKFPLKECASFQSLPFRASSPSTPFYPCELPKDGKECVSFLMDFVRLSALENRMGELKVRPGQFR